MVLVLIEIDIKICPCLSHLHPFWKSEILLSKYVLDRFILAKPMRNLIPMTFMDEELPIHILMTNAKIIPKANVNIPIKVIVMVIVPLDSLVLHLMNIIKVILSMPTILMVTMLTLIQGLILNTKIMTHIVTFLHLGLDILVIFLLLVVITTPSFSLLLHPVA